MKRAPLLWASIALLGPLALSPVQAAGTEIVGRISEAGGAPVAGADVVVSRRDGSARRVAITDSAGRFALLPGHIGETRLLLVSGRGVRVVEGTLFLSAGTRTSLVVHDDPAAARLEIVATRVEGAGLLPLDNPLALSRGRDLEGALTALPGTTPATAPAGAPVLAGLPAAEIPVTFAGFLLNDPMSGAPPLEMALSLFDGAVVETGLAPGIVLAAPDAARNDGDVLLGADVVTPARGADGATRPAGTTWSLRGQAAVQRVWAGRGRLSARVSYGSGTWRSDPSSVAGPRGQRLSGGSTVIWGELLLGGWQLAGGGLTTVPRLRYGRGARVLGPAEPRTEEGAGAGAALLGVTARRQLGPGDNDLSFRLGALSTRRTTTFAALDERESSGRRFSLAGVWRVGGEFGGRHRFTVTAGFDWETGERKGRETSRQAGLVTTGAEGSGRLPALELSERWSPTPWLELEAALFTGLGDYEGTTSWDNVAATKRSFSTDVMLAPRLRASVRPFANTAGGSGLAFHAQGGRSTTRLPLDAVMGPADGPRFDLPLPAEDGVAVGTELSPVVGPGVLQLALQAGLRRNAGVVEDRFAPASGRLELFSPAQARREFRFLSASGSYRRAGLVVGVAGIVSRLQGNHVGFVDEATGALRPAGTGAFDGPDVEVNRTGALPFDRPYGARLFLSAAWPGLPAHWGLHGALRGRIDAGTPRSATARSAASGEGQIFVLPRGSLGRTRAVGALDAGLVLRRRFAGQWHSFTLEGFNLTQHRPAVARVARQSDATPGQLVDPSAENPDFQRAIAYAEPLLIRLLAGIEF